MFTVNLNMYSLFEVLAMKSGILDTALKHNRGVGWQFYGNSVFKLDLSKVNLQKKILMIIEKSQSICVIN